MRNWAKKLGDLRVRDIWRGTRALWGRFKDLLDWGAQWKTRWELILAILIALAINLGFFGWLLVGQGSPGARSGRGTDAPVVAVVPMPDVAAPPPAEGPAPMIAIPAPGPGAGEAPPEKPGELPPPNLTGPEEKPAGTTLRGGSISGGSIGGGH